MCYKTQQMIALLIESKAFFAFTFILTEFLVNIFRRHRNLCNLSTFLLKINILVPFYSRLIVKTFTLKQKIT